MQRRYSKQREMILQYVRGSVEHPTPEMVYQGLLADCPNLSRGTVYRNLKLLAEEGVLERMPFTVERFDGRVEPHPHFICRSCGGVQDLEFVYEDEMDRKVCAAAGHQVEYHATYFYGVCSGCVKAQG